MSSAILYVAIVAIWAGVLIPRWLKRDTSQAATSSPAATGGQPAGASQDAHADGAETMTGDITGHDAGTGQDTAGGDGGTKVAARGGTAPAAAPEDRMAYEDGAAGRPEQSGGQGGSGPDRAQSRQPVVTARRRLLLVLVSLTVAALGIAGLKLAAWWVAVPPILMLSGYVTLLREASRADRERAVLAAAAHHEEQRPRYAEQQAAQRAPEAAAAPVMSPTARVIDISGRVRDEDEIYDQYADGTRRAVGD